MLAPSLAPRGGQRPLVRLLSPIVLAGLVLAGCAGRMNGKEPEDGKLADNAAGKADGAAADKPAEKGTGEKSGGDKAGGKTAHDADRAALEELRELAERSFEESLGFFEAGDAFGWEVYHWSRVLLEHDLALADEDEKKLLATQAHLDRMMNLAHAGLWRSRELEYYVSEAELKVNRLKPNPEFAATIAARKALEGQWEVVSIEEDGGASPKPDIKSITIVGRRAVFEHRLGTAKALLILEPGTKPASIDILGLNEDFPFGGQGIYKLDGDTLTLCWGVGAVRPTDFVTKPGDNATLCVLKRG
ncbi:MAG TPA: TIGR03067 domain-containing protein [Pirellulales bacterium]|nr:TIGR03067 domain-containing protein [Pirellulales bacterium]